MSSLSKIEGILSAFGYDNGTIGEIKVSDENDILSISFKITKPKDEEKLPWKRPNIVPTQKDKVSYISKVNITSPVVEEPKKKVTFEEFCKQSSKEVTYDPVSDRIVEGKSKIIFSDEKKAKSSKWKTSTPKVMLRNVYFKSHDDAKEFAENYERDFEYAKSQTIGKDSLEKWTLGKNNDCNELFKKGYGYVLRFRMNGKIFETLEGIENLKKLPKGSKRIGTHCIRYKEG